MHALAAWWLLIHQAESDEDVLLVSIADGQIGAALLVEGRPNRGCATGANELGHVRFFVETDTCYCGHPGCLERIVSTEFLRRRGVATGTLLEHAARFGSGQRRRRRPRDKAMNEIIDYLSAGLANACNFIRPNRLVLSSEFTRYPAFSDALQRSIRSRLLHELVKRIRIDQWDQVDSHMRRDGRLARAREPLSRRLGPTPGTGRSARRRSRKPPDAHHEAQSRCSRPRTPRTGVALGCFSLLLIRIGFVSSPAKRRRWHISPFPPEIAVSRWLRLGSFRRAGGVSDSPSPDSAVRAFWGSFGHASEPVTHIGFIRLSKSDDHLVLRAGRPAVPGFRGRAATARYHSMDPPRPQGGCNR